MKQIIDKILNEYISAKKEQFAGHPLGEYFRKYIPEYLYNTGVIDKEKYLITGSVGQGNWAAVPWIGIFDKQITTSATKGVYIVYLLSKSGKTLYLTFNQGCTDIRNTNSKSETIKIMRQKAEDIVSKIDSRGFSTDENINLGDGLKELAELYQKGTIFYKAYNRGNVPSTDDLLEDLEKMMGIYNEYVSLLSMPQVEKSERAMGKFDSWEIEDENTAVKTCDKSFFEYNSSGIPQDIRWFFEVEDLKPGEKREVAIEYKGSKFISTIRNTIAYTPRTLISWNTDLARLFNQYKEIEKVKAVFKKLNDNIYRISFEGGTVVIDEENMSDKDLINKIKLYISSKGFSYENNLIENFYLSLKSKPFVILAGTSGTGKTRLVRLFAQAAGATADNGRYKMVAVRPDWSDSSDLLGHMDLNGNFIPGAIIDFVKAAENDKEKPYFLCLDEMNLARVEYYLSDILSIIETRDLKNGEIITDPLVEESYYGGDSSAAAKYGKISLPENLYIIGTVNMDETTFPFSRKVLDRANTIEFSYVDLMPNFDMPKDYSEPLDIGNEFFKSKYLLLNQCFDDAEFVNMYCSEIRAINEILKRANAHIGYRVRDEIIFYMLNNKKAKLLSDDEAFDNAIMQKILPRIQGSSNLIKTMLCDLFKHCASDYEGIQSDDNDASAKMFKVSRSGKYKNSADKIAFMVRRFEEDGFTSFWL